MEDKRLAHLMEYTKFHIGAYITLCSALTGVIGFNVANAEYTPYLSWTLVCFAAAAAFGGLVGSGIPYCRDFEEFKKAKLGPWRAKIVPALVCTHLEHSIFWVGITIAIIGLFMTGGTSGSANVAR